MTVSKSKSEPIDFLCFADTPSCRIAGSPKILPPSRGFHVNSLNVRDGLFEKFEELVEIEVCCNRAMVPENNKLLRCFQYINMDSVSVGDYCWNGECTNCQVWYRTEDGEVKSGLACRMYVRAGMIITDLSANLKTDLIS